MCRFLCSIALSHVPNKVIANALVFANVNFNGQIHPAIHLLYLLYLHMDRRGVLEPTVNLESRELM